MAAEYKNVITGKLALKGALAPTIDKTKKRKKSKGLDAKFAKFLKEHQDAEDVKAPSGDDDKPVDTRTPSERQFDAIQAALEDKRIKAKISKSHREKIEEFNKYLEGLSEHNDIPRVGPG